MHLADPLLAPAPSPREPLDAPIAEHWRSLVLAAHIRWELPESVEDAWACRRCRLIVTPWPVCRITYLTALHELGHLLAPDQWRQRVLERELGAWEWAAEHSLLPLDEVLRADIVDCLGSYVITAQQDRRFWMPEGDGWWARYRRLLGQDTLTPRG